MLGSIVVVAAFSGVPDLALGATFVDGFLLFRRERRVGFRGLIARHAFAALGPEARTAEGRRGCLLDALAVHHREVLVAVAVALGAAISVLAAILDEHALAALKLVVG